MQTNVSPMPALLRPSEVAHQLGVCRSKVYALIRARRLPSITIGSSIRVPAKAVEQLVDEAMRKQADAA